MVKFAMGMGQGGYVTELCEFHSSNVNPNELSMPHGFFEEDAVMVQAACS